MEGELQGFGLIFFFGGGRRQGAFPGTFWDLKMDIILVKSLRKGPLSILFWSGKKDPMNELSQP